MATLTATVSSGLRPVICSGLGGCESWTTTRDGTATFTGDAAIWKKECVLKTDNVRDWRYCSSKLIRASRSRRYHRRWAAHFPQTGTKKSRNDIMIE